MARKVDTEEFIRMARLVHGDKYDYSNTHYTRGKDQLVIICRKHGYFTQRASNHLRGSGCPHCFQERNGGIVCGVGINDIGQSDIRLFTTWRGMLFRCYDKKYNAAYSGCEVCDEWKRLSSFALWYNLHHVAGWQLDKDILGNGKLYSHWPNQVRPSYDAFKAGAEWDREKILKEATTYEVVDFGIEPHPHINVSLNPEEYADGDKVKLVILPKEERP